MDPTLDALPSGPVSFAPLRYVPYDQSTGVPNVVVDGSPNEGTVLTLSHWPGTPTPERVAADLSAQMAFRYLEQGESLHGAAEVVTNNHFDQDGLVAIFALARPEDAMARRDLLEDLAAAGDFGTYRDRRAARLSMVLAAATDPGAGLVAAGDDPYAVLLERLPDLIDHLDDHRDLWAEEDEQLAQSEAALASGEVTLAETPELDLAVVTLPAEGPRWGGHRFSHRHFDGLHPMAVDNATTCFRLFLAQGRHYQYTDRYETWVQYRSRRPLPRVDLRPLAAALTAAETDGAVWEAEAPGDLTPELRLVGGGPSSLDVEVVLGRLREHLWTSPAAFDPYP